MSQARVTRYYSVKKRNKERDNKVIKNQSADSSVSNKLKNAPAVSETCITKHSDVKESPKRNLSDPDELTPSKKKALLMGHKQSSIKKDNVQIALDSLAPETTKNARRKLHMSSLDCARSASSSPVKSSPIKSPQKAETEKLNAKSIASVINNSRTKVLLSGRLDELRESLKKFENSLSKAEDYQSNSFKITSVISTKQSSGDQSAIKQSEPAYKKYSHLTSPKTSSLVLPFKYKLLCDTFRCLDTVVSMMYNRKEEVTFEKVQKGVQKMTNRNFTKTHLGQILTILPKAYSLHYEKYTVIGTNKVEYKLVMEPNLNEYEDCGDKTLITQGPKSSGFIRMSPQLLTSREHLFSQNILKLVKQYHQTFLSKLKFPPISDDSILRWHPKFQVDSVPDVECAKLPEEPEVKICTAKDVLNKIRGTVKGRLEKALQNVAERQSASEDSSSSTSESKADNNKKKNSALQGICTDLLERIRARESAKLIESMTRSPEEQKKLAMMERVPKIVHILWHYFIAERKAAVPVDAAIEKITHSLNTLITPSEVREYLQLITEKCPGWLAFIKISKGEYITMDKKKDINVLLSNLK